MTKVVHLTFKSGEIAIITGVTALYNYEPGIGNNLWLCTPGFGRETKVWFPSEDIAKCFVFTGRL